MVEPLATALAVARRVPGGLIEPVLSRALEGDALHVFEPRTPVATEVSPSAPRTRREGSTRQADALVITISATSTMRSPQECRREAGLLTLVASKAAFEPPRTLDERVWLRQGN